MTGSNEMNTITRNVSEQAQEIADLVSTFLADKNTGAKYVTNFPAFNPDRPEWFFKSIEASFSLKKITDPEKQLQQLVFNMPDKLRPYYDAIESETLPAGESKYTQFKKAVLQTFKKTADQKLHEVLRGIPMQNLKPSYYLILLEDKAQGQLDDKVIKRNLLDQLPPDIKTAALTTNPPTSEEVAALANHFWENTQTYSVNAMSNPLPQVEINKIDSTMGQLQLSIVALQTQLAAMNSNIVSLQTEVQDVKKKTNHRGRSQS